MKTIIFYICLVAFAVTVQSQPTDLIGEYKLVSFLTQDSTLVKADKSTYTMELTFNSDSTYSLVEYKENAILRKANGKFSFKNNRLILTDFLHSEKRNISKACFSYSQEGQMLHIRMVDKEAQIFVSSLVEFFTSGDIIYMLCDWNLEKVK